MRTMLALALCLGLIACKTTSGAPDAAQTVYTLEGALTAAIQVATTYKQLPVCASGGPVLCSDPGTVSKIDAAAVTAVSAVQAAQVAVTTGGTSAASINADIAAAETALNALMAVTSTVKIA
jgi:hypothetical protein